MSPETPTPWDHQFKSLQAFSLRHSQASVFIGDAGENLGYGGGVNRWLKPLLAEDWPGIFVLNPDAAPAPDALAILKAYADRHGKGMVTGRIVLADAPEKIHTRGLRFHLGRVTTEAVGRLAPSDIPPDIARVEAYLDAPSGAAFYATRGCIERIGLMREEYFLYYEDLDWGMKAKRSCGLGYAFGAVIVHKGGTTIGTGSKVSGSAFSAFLEFRNCLLFVAAVMPRWYLWVLLVRSIRAWEFVLVGRFDKTKAALRGIMAALRGKTGRPDDMLESHRRR